MSISAASGATASSSHRPRQARHLSPPPARAGERARAARHPLALSRQGLAIDAKTGGLVGIDRDKKQIVFGELKE